MFDWLAKVTALVLLGGFSTSHAQDAITMMDQGIPKLLSQFMLLDATGNRAPPYLPGTRIAPFAAVVELHSPELEITEPSKSVIKYDLRFAQNGCSAVHLVRGEVLTHQSCLKKMVAGERSWPFLIYYNNEGVRRNYRIDTFEPWDSNNDTQKIRIRLPKAVALEFDALSEAPAYEGPGRFWPDMAKALPVRIWSFDELSQHPKIEARYTVDGEKPPFSMIFAPRLCWAPAHALAIRFAKKGVHPTQEEWSIPLNLGFDNADESNIYLDRCDANIVAGNFGAYISEAQNPLIRIGVLYGSLTWGSFRQMIMDPRNFHDAQWAPLQQMYPDETNYEFHFTDSNHDTWRFHPFQEKKANNGLFGLGHTFDYLDRAISHYRSTLKSR